MSLTPHSPLACEAQLLSLALSRVQGQHSWQGKACIHGYSLVLDFILKVTYSDITVALHGTLNYKENAFIYCGKYKWAQYEQWECAAVVSGRGEGGGAGGGGSSEAIFIRPAFREDPCQEGGVTTWAPCSCSTSCSYSCSCSCSYSCSCSCSLSCSCSRILWDATYIPFFLGFPISWVENVVPYSPTYGIYLYKVHTVILHFSFVLLHIS